MDELDALLAATARNNNDNATQNGNSFDIFIRVVRLYVLVYNIMGHVYYVVVVSLYYVIITVYCRTGS